MNCLTEIKNLKKNKGRRHVLSKCKGRGPQKIFRGLHPHPRTFWGISPRPTVLWRLRRHMPLAPIRFTPGSAPVNVVGSGVLTTCISDHYLVYVCRKFRGSLSAQHKVITSRQMKNFDKDLFLNDLASVDWSAIVYNSDDVDSAVCQ